MAGGQNLGEAVLKITLDTKTLKTQLDQLKKDIEGVQAGPVKLKPDGTSTRSRTTPADTAAKKAAADEARRVSSLNALEARRFRIGRELNKLEERGVNISRLRSKLESNTLRRSSSQAEITSAREQTRSLERQVALRKDLADKEKRANAATKQAVVAPPPPPPKPPRLPDRGLDRTPLEGSVREVGSPAFGTRGARQGGQSESINALTNASKTRYRLNQQLNALERAGVNTSKLRAQLGEATTAQARRQFGSFKQIAGSLQFALTKEKDRLRVQKELNAEKAKDTRVRPISFDGGARESLTAKTDAQRKRARLNQQLNSLEASGVKTTKLRAQLGEATTAQANRQFGTFNQIANKLSDSLRAEREKLKIQRQQSNELKGQVTEEKRIGKLNASPVRGGVSFAGSPVALEVAARAEQRLAKDRAAAAEKDNANNKRIAKANASSIRGSLGQEGSPAFNAARDKRDRESARDGRRIGSLNASPVRGGVSFPGSPVALEVAARAEQRLAKERAAAAAATQKAADKDNANNKRIAKGNASPVGGGAAFRGSPKANAALDAEGKRVGGLNASPVRGGIGFKGSPIALEVAAKAEERLTKARQRAEQTTLKAAAAEAKQSAAEGKRVGQLNTSPVRGGIAFKNSPAFIAAEEKRTQERNARRAEKISARQDYLSTGGRDRSILTGTSAFARPDPQAVRAEQELQKARAKTAAQTLRTTTAENRKQERERAARSKQINERIGGTLSSGLIGGGFPLLFGQGAGAAAGGAVGGLAGGAIGGGFGFALSVVGTAIGAAFDEALEKGKLLATGLDDPIAQFESLRQAALFSSKGVEKNIAALIAAGRTEEAKIVSQGDLNATFGGAENAQKFAAATDELNRAWTEATVTTANFVAGPLADFIKVLNANVKLPPAVLTGANTKAEGIVNNNFNQLEKSFGVNKEVTFEGKKFKGDANSVRTQIRDDIILQAKATKDAAAAQNENKAASEATAEALNRSLQINKSNLALIKAQTAGNRTVALDEQERLITLEKTRKLNSLSDKADPVERQTIETQAVAELAKVDAERIKIQNDLNQALANEAIIRRGIAQQIAASVAQQGAALARGDSAANPGNSVLAARAGDAEARAFLEQNRQGVNSARSAEAQLQNQIKFEVDPSKIAELQSKLATAAQATKLAMVEAGTALASKAADAAASLQGARDGLRSTLEGNIDKLPGQAQVDLKRQALGDVQRGVQNGILRPNINFNNTKSLLENASFVRQVEVARAQVTAAEAQINALNANTQALQQGGAINVTINSDGAGGWQSGGAERVAA